MRLSLVLMLAALVLASCSDPGREPIVIDDDTGYLPDPVDTETEPLGVDTDPANVPDLNFAMPCFDYRIYSYTSWGGTSDFVNLINDDGMALGFRDFGSNIEPLARRHTFSFNEREFGEAHNSFVNLGDEVIDTDSDGTVDTDMVALHMKRLLPLDMNNNGRVVGYAQVIGDVDEEPKAVYYDDLYEVHKVFDDDTPSLATAVSESGTVVGWSEDSNLTVIPPDFDITAWVFDGAVTTLAHPDADTDPDSMALGINGDLVVGAGTNDMGEWLPFIWDKASTLYIPLYPLPLATEAYAYAVDANGDVVGESLFPDGTSAPTLWPAADYATPEDLGLLQEEVMAGGRATGMGANGEILGYDVPVGTNTEKRGWIHEDGAKKDLTSRINPASGFRVLEVHDINASGVMVASVRHFQYTNTFSIALVPQSCNVDTDSQ